MLNLAQNVARFWRPRLKVSIELHPSPSYSCPRCNAAYCSLACYRRPEHEGCYEQFYRECVRDEMALRSKEDAEGDPAVKRRMIETLKRMRQQGGVTYSTR